MDRVVLKRQVVEMKERELSFCVCVSTYELVNTVFPDS